MGSDIILQMFLAAIAAVIIYTIIGFIPGTDETSVLMPITLALVLSGLEPIVVLTFFIAAIVTLNITNSIPTALVGLPGGVMSSPMMEHSLYLKDKGLSAVLIKKMAVGSLIGVLVSLPLALILANIIAPFGASIKQYASLLFLIGAIFLSLISKARILSLISIVPLSVLFMALRHLYWGLGIVEAGKNITVSFFLGITVGPLIVSLLGLLNREQRNKVLVEGKKHITIPGEGKAGKTLNPFKIATKSEMKKSFVGAFIANFLFVLSPVGLTILLGESLGKTEKDKVGASFATVSTMSALGQATYLSGMIIPLLALGMPLSPVSIGPGIALFEAQPVFTQTRNIHHILSGGQITLAIVMGALLAILCAYFLTNRYAGKISEFVLKKIPHEAILALFIAFIVLLAYMDAGIINIFGVILIGIVSGSLNKLGVNYGVQFMTLYASSWIIANII